MTPERRSKGIEQQRAAVGPLSPASVALLLVSVLVVGGAAIWFGWQAFATTAHAIVITAPAGGATVSEGSISTVSENSQSAPPSPPSATATRPAATAAPSPAAPPTEAVIYLPTATPPPSDTPTPPPRPTPAMPDDPLTGLPVARARTQLRPIIVMIDNHPDAVPQSGLDKAAVVYEALAEGGITRFMAVFDAASPAADEIGPVRSARIYYVNWALPYHPIYVHAGGSPGALNTLPTLSAVDNTDLLVDGPSWRSSDRLMPHNLYISSASMEQWAAAQGMSAGDYADNRLLHKPDQPRPDHPRISFDFGTISRSDVVWSYNAAGNNYLRTMWGQAHYDRITGQQLSAKNVIILFTTRADIIGDEKGRIEVGTVGGGDALFAVDGTVLAGRWQKDSDAAPLRFYDSNGAEMQFNRGNMWIEVLPNGQQITY